MVHPIVEENAAQESTRSRTILHMLRRQILSGEIASGTHLHEVALSEALSVSRTPIRESLGVLAHEGLLEYRPNRGYVVKRFGVREIVDALVVRHGLEMIACRIVAEAGLDRPTSDRLAALLEEAFAILEKGYVTRADWAPYRDIDARFHRTILEATGNRRLVELAARAVTVPMVSSLAINWSDLKLGYRRGIKGQLFHKKIYDALTAGDGARAMQQMDRHFCWGIANLKSDFSHAMVDDVTHFTLSARNVRL
jgi:GntR family transcriptional regulator of vanillate catabolism